MLGVKTFYFVLKFSRFRKLILFIFVQKIKRKFHTRRVIDWVNSKFLVKIPTISFVIF